MTSSSWRRPRPLALLLGALLLTATAAQPREAPPVLTVLSQFDVPDGNPQPESDLPVNVRWADDRSVYLVRHLSGVRQVALTETLPVLHEVFPDRSKMLPFSIFKTFAVSPGFMAVGSGYELAWRRAPRQGLQFLLVQNRMGRVEDLDLRGRQIALLGLPEPAVPFSGGAVWLGPLGDKPLEQLKPILRDEPEAERVTHCTTLGMSHLRFLPDGSLLAAVGFEPRLYLFDRDGQQVRTWDTASLGFDACGQISDAVSRRINVDIPYRFAWLNEHSVLEAILPLPQGPGLLIRSVRDGKVHWQLKVLEATQVSTYAVPITGELPYARLRGDVRGDRIVLLLSDHVNTPGRATHPARLIVLQVPAANVGAAQ